MGKIMFVDVIYKGKIKLSDEFLNYLINEGYKKIALYTTTQFNHKIKDILKQLENKDISVVSSQPERTNRKFQILGCDVYHRNMNLDEGDADCYLYIGDGKFHPNALIFKEIDSQKKNPEREFKKIIIYNPINNSYEVLTDKDVEKVVKKKNANLSKFYSADSVGVLITTKPGQSHFHYVKKLESKYPDKKFYSFITDNVDFNEMENFPFVECWINTACPRIGLEDVLNTRKSLLNAEDVLI